MPCAVPCKYRELFALYQLLSHVPHPRDYDDLRRKPDGTMEPPGPSCFQNVARAHSLLYDDTFWDTTFAEIVGHSTGWRDNVRAFALIVMNNDLNDPVRCFMDYAEHMSPRLRGTGTRGFDIGAGVLFLSARLQRHGKTLDDVGLLPLLDRCTVAQRNAYLQGRCDELLEQQAAAANDDEGWWEQRAARNEQALNQAVAQMQLTDEQQAALNTLTAALEDSTLAPHEGGSMCATAAAGVVHVFAIDGPAGSGKTTLLRRFAAVVRDAERKILFTAATAIAAGLLPAGKTVHKMFGVPTQLLGPNSTSNHKLHEAAAATAREALVWVVDEVSMLHVDILKLLDRHGRALTGQERPYGGKIVVFTGDFRQLPPVVRGANDATVAAASAKSDAAVWGGVHSLRLTVNVRSATAGGNAEWAAYVQRVGDGVAQPIDPATPQLLDMCRTPAGDICLPHGSTPLDLLTHAYPSVGVDGGVPTAEELQEGMVIAARHEHVDELNRIMTERHPGEVHVYLANDSFNGTNFNTDDDDATMALATLRNIPPRRLDLKPGMPVMCLKNLQFGLSNGTRLLILTCLEASIFCRVLDGPCRGQNLYVPRVCHYESNIGGFEDRVRRVQIPVVPAFAATIHKVQGATLARVGIDLRSAVFVHGQFYVALTRCGHPANIRILTADEQHGIVHNIVFPSLVA